MGRQRSCGDGGASRGPRAGSIGVFGFRRMAFLAIACSVSLEACPGGGPLGWLLQGLAALRPGSVATHSLVEPPGPGAARALELGGASLFVKAPWKVDLISYSTTVGQPQPEYYLTLELEPDAGASLASFRFQQIRGADWQFPFSPERTYAFLGRPRHQGRRVPVQARWDPDSRTMEVSFPDPVPPGSTVTTVLIPWFNPMQSDTYLFAVEVFPAGPNPVGSSAGVGTLRIYQFSNW